MTSSFINLFNLFAISLILSACGTNRLDYSKINSQEKCACKKEGYWYNDKCWKGFEDERIPASKIDSVVRAEIKEIEKSIITIDNKQYPLVGFMPFPEEEKIYLITVFLKENAPETMISVIPQRQLRKKKFKSKVVLLKGSPFNGEMDSIPLAKGVSTVYPNIKKELSIEVSGKLMNDKDTVQFNYTGNKAISGAGTSKLTILGKEAILSGDLGTITYYQIDEMIKNHPEVRTLVLTQISGSINDAVNVHTGRLVRNAGLNTKVLSDSEIASGGVDLFCSGVERIVEKGAKIGVHSWCCVNDLSAEELPKEHPAHQDQLNYFTQMMGELIGPKFYFYTLESASFDNIHWMSDSEIQQWKVATQFIE